MKFSEAEIAGWTRPASKAETVRMNNSRNAVISALQTDPSVDFSIVKIVDKGSSHNNTNVKLKADVDLSLVQEGDFFYGLPAGYTKEHFGIIPGTQSYATYKRIVIDAILNYFERNAVDNSSDKCTTIQGDQAIADTDVIPTWRYRLYRTDGQWDEGVAFHSDKGELVVNFPEQHTTNGNEKNNRTGRKYKRVVRILKRLKIKMQEDGVTVSDSITSFLIESLVWNVDDRIFSQNDNYTEVLKNVLIEIYANTSEDWNEVSNLLRLFHADRKWTIQETKDFIEAVWVYCGYNE
jgi:hypothetical protein